jgi:hypothetical protein
MTEDLLLLLLLLGTGLVATGTGLIYAPAGLIAAGALLIVGVLGLGDEPVVHRCDPQGRPMPVDKTKLEEWGRRHPVLREARGLGA